MALDKCGDGKRAKDARLVRPKGNYYFFFF